MKLLDGQLGLNFDEGRGKLRYARVRCMQPLTPRFPNAKRVYAERQSHAGN